MTHRPRGTLRNPALATLAALLLTGCATGYGSAWGGTGGYSESQVDETHWRVGFRGNGFTSRERVWYFWFYRCAEMTAAKGFAYFGVEGSEKGEQLGLLDDTEGARLWAGIPPAPRAGPAPAGFIYIPGNSSVTWWNSSAVVAMYPTIPAGKVLFSTQRVFDLLGPYVRANGHADPPDRKALLRGSVMRLGASQTPERVFPDGAKLGYLDVKRLMVGVSEGRAALARQKASFTKRQAELDAWQVQIGRVRKARDGEASAAKRAELDADLESKTKQAAALLKRIQVELMAEERSARERIVERAAPVVERVRTAQGLDAVTNEAAGGLWDAEITDEVIRQYEVTYPSPSGV